MEQKFWQVCELEDEVQSFVEISVAAVPDIWIVQLIDGSYICYWPKEKAAKKIREFANPKDGGVWEAYKCRILMKGAKYSRYEDAREAEIDAQDLSLESTKALDSTMDFSVSDGDIGKEENWNEKVDNDVSQLHSTMDFDISDDVEKSGEMTGNDTSKFNKAVSLTPHYRSTNMMGENVVFRQDDLCDFNGWFQLNPSEKQPERYASSCSSEISGYSNRFGADDFLTSTADDVNDNDTPALDRDTIMSKITALEVMVSSFYEDIKKDLKDIKKCLSSNMGNVINSEGIAEQLVNQNHDYNSATFITKGQANQIEMLICTGSQDIDGKDLVADSEDNIPKIYELLENDIILDEYIAEPHSIHTNENLGAPFQPMDETFNVPEQLKMNIDDEVEVIENEDLLVPVAANDETFALPAQLKMKMINSDEFGGNENLLELDEEMEKDMIERLLPLHEEPEAVYVKRIIDLLFEDTFFLNKITWKVEKDRQCIKHSNTLKCWKVNYESTFGADEKDQKLMAHFRRIKSAKRAANKAANPERPMKRAANKAANPQRPMKRALHSVEKK